MTTGKTTAGYKGIVAVLAAVLCLWAKAAAVRAQDATATPDLPAEQPKAGWEEVDQRLVFLTVELSTVESSLDATNRALVANGYQKAVREQQAANAQQGNELMDRNGGGPVPWQQFYGRTAERFFYHPTDDNTVYLNPDAEDQRPPQFDYIYRANEESRQTAEDDAARIGQKISDLLDYRRQLEGKQNVLWCKIALRGVASKELASH